MSRPSARIRVWTRPRLPPPPPDEPAGSADRLWTDGEAAEAAYEFEAAHACYRAAVRAAPNARALDYISRYAEFLVERFGQFDEVAAWLDDAAFDAPFDDGSPAARSLCRNLAKAANEAGHPRAVTLDSALAAQGDPDALDRAAQRLVQADRPGEARALLERHASRLRPLSPAERLLEQLRHDEQRRGAEAVRPAEALLQAHDVSGARAALESLRGAWAQAPAFLSLEARVREAEAQARASGLRQALDEALDRGDLAAAHDAARSLCALDVATDADRNYLAFVDKRRREAALQAQVGRAQAATAPDSVFAETARLHDDFGIEAADFPAGSAQATAWRAVREAAGLQPGPLAGRATDLRHLAALQAALDGQGEAGLAQALRALPEPWQTGPSGQRARAAVQSRQEAEHRLAEAAFVAQVQALLDTGELDGAAAALADWTRRHKAPGPEVRQLRHELQACRQQEERRVRLRTDLGKAMDGKAFFQARALLSELAHLVTADERTTWQQRVDEAAPALRARPVPPGMLKLGTGPLVCGIGHGRLVLAQDTLWLAVNLETLGLQPFALPTDWPVEVHAWTRLGSAGDKLRLCGLSRGRLAVWEQVPGQPPAVVAGLPLADVLRGDDLLLGAALNPDGREFVLLSRSSQRGPGTTWTRLDAATLEVLEYRRTQPTLENVCGIAGLPEATLVATTPRERYRGVSLAAAKTDLRGEPTLRLAVDELGEAVAGFRQAMAWPDQDRVYASFSVLDPFDPGRVRTEPSLLVLRGDRVSFASSELRRRFVPVDRVAIDHAWTLDPVAGRLWFAALPMDGPEAATTPGPEHDALLLGVDARTLRPDRPARLEGVERVLALQPVPDGAVALTRLHGGGYALVRARMAQGELALTAHKLPL